MKKICSKDNCEKPANSRGLCKSHYIKEYKNKNRAHINVTRNALRKKWQMDAFKILGGNCESCGEKLDPTLPRSNLTVHHRFYSEVDQIRRSKYHHIVPYTLSEIQNKKKSKQNPKKKFGVLCGTCNSIEGFVRKDPKKAFEAFCWIYGEGIFDKILADDERKDEKSHMRITDFLSKDSDL